MSKNILLICYSFPPHPGIGGRRWAKFSKYLSYKDFKITVFNAENISHIKSLWNRDIIENRNIMVNSFKFQFQNILFSPKHVIQKIFRKILIKSLKLVKYTPDIITSFPNPKFWKAIENTIKADQIDLVIVSGDPYLFYYAAKLKQKLNYNLVLDYRDLWNDHSFYRSFVTFSKPQKLFFEYAENFAVNNCSTILCVDDHLKKTIKNRLKNDCVNIITLHNGFDKDDFKNLVLKDLNLTGKLNLFFAGTISSDLNNQLFHFIQSFEELKNKLPQVYHKFQINISGTIDHYLIEEINNLKLENLFVDADIKSNEEYYYQLNEAQIGLTILSDEYKNSFITKFSDYLYLNKYTVSIGESGDFSDFLKENKIGTNFTVSDNYLFFKNLLDEMISFNSSFIDLKQQFDIVNLTKKLQYEIS